MLKTLRSSTKWVMIIVSVSFVGMMVFAWGMDITGRRSSKAGIVGIINGRKITYDYYNALIQQRREMMGNDQRSSLDMDRRLNDEVWNEIVMQTLIDQEIKKRKITFTDKELISYMVSNPVQGALQAPMFQGQNGSFDIEKYKQFILNPENLKNPQTAQIVQAIESQARNSLPIMKLQRRVAAGFIVSDARVREEWLDQNEQRRIGYVWLSSSRLATPDMAVDPKAVETYFNAHREEFKREETRALDFVFFRLAATERDSAEVRDRATMIADRAVKGEDFAGLADGYSEDAGNKNQEGKGIGGDLGFVQRGRMVKEFEDVAFAMKPGEISKPFLSRFGWHIVKCDSLKYGDAAAPADKKTKNAPKEVTEVKIRHILLKIEPSAQTRDEAESAANEFFDKTSVKGADFATAAKASKLEVVRTPFFKKDDPYIPYIGGNCSLLAQRAFKAKKGVVLPRYQVDGGFFVMRVAETKPAGIPSLADVRGDVEMKVRTEQASKQAAEFAARVLERVKGGMTLNEAFAADQIKTAEINADISITKAGNIPGVGTRSVLALKAFTIDTVGANTGVVSTLEGAGFAVLNEKIAIDETRFTSDKPQMISTIENKLQSMATSQYLEQIKKKAKIVDNRSDIFQL